MGEVLGTWWGRIMMLLGIAAVVGVIVASKSGGRFQTVRATLRSSRRSATATR